MAGEYAPSLDGIDMPQFVRDLPVCPVRKIPVPWFVAWVDGVPEFRAAAAKKWADAVRMSLCWVCGRPLRKLPAAPASGRLRPRLSHEMAFVIGPMCVINRVTSEPPCHPECARFSARACPFLAKPHMVRRETGPGAEVMEKTVNPGGVMIRRNPGCVAVYLAAGYSVEDDGRGGRVIGLGEPVRVDWYAEGRAATAEEVRRSIDSGVCHLFPDGPPGPVVAAEFERMRAAAEKWLPPIEVVACPVLPAQPVAGSPTDA